MVVSFSGLNNTHEPYCEHLPYPTNFVHEKMHKTQENHSNIAIILLFIHFSLYFDKIR